MTKPIETPTILQMEAVECGAASLAIILAHHGRFIPLEKLREDCGVSRDGSKASNVLKAARDHGLDAEGYRLEPDDLGDLPLPAILHWGFDHFLVLEGIDAERAWLNDPATGRRTVTRDELDRTFTGVALAFEPSEAFATTAPPPSVFSAMRARLRGAETGVLFLVVTGLALAVPGLVVPALSRIFVDDVLLAGRREWLVPLVLGLGLTALVRGALVWLERRTLVALHARLVVASTARFLSHVLELPLSFFLARRPGDLASRVGLNDRIAAQLSGKLAETALDLVMLVFFGALLLAYDVELTLAVFLLSLANVAVFRALSKKRFEENLRVELAGSALEGVAASGLSVIETLKASGTESDFFRRWAGHWAKLHEASQKLRLVDAALASTPTLLSGLVAAVVVVIGGRAVMAGELTVGTLVAYQTLVASFLAPIGRLVALGPVIQELKTDLVRLSDVEAYEIAGGRARPAGPQDRAKLSGRIELRNVTFGYARHGEPLLRDFSLVVEPGTRVALVGGSGSGKSTIARLVAGLYQPWEGEILFDGRPRSDVPDAVFAASVSMVDQEIALFEGTIRENVALWDEHATEADVVQAAKDAAVHDEIAVRPGGYDGPVEEGGRNFSGGQRQRLEIARALVRRPTVLLLDEATSALDPKSEKSIDDNLRRRGVTCLIVAHRLSTIRDADEIIVLERGVVVERGRHESLMRAGGVYARLMATA